MRGSTCTCLLTLSLVFLPPGLLRGQTDRADPTPDVLRDFALIPPRAVPRPEPPGPLPHRPVTAPGAIGLPQLAQVAGMIFSATVTGIARRPASGGQAIETVAITFHVEDVIRGARPGEDLTIAQWIGLWSSGQRYRIGEHALVFLYPPSKLGLTSCVGGPLGRFNLDSLGRVISRRSSFPPSGGIPSWAGSRG